MTTTAYEPPEVEELDVGPLPQHEAELIALGDMLLQRLGQSQRERAANAAALKIQQASLAAAYEELDAPMALRERRIETELERILGALPLNGKKSRKLAFDELAYRTIGARLVVVDEGALRAAASKADSTLAELYEEQPAQLNKRALNDRFKGSGEIPPGCVLVSERQEFYAKPKDGAR